MSFFLTSATREEQDQPTNPQNLISPQFALRIVENQTSLHAAIEGSDYSARTLLGIQIETESVIVRI